ncbi:MAG: DUF192 domain-containing protein [Candidatus Woesearchaeota archaeon]
MKLKILLIFLLVFLVGCQTNQYVFNEHILDENLNEEGYDQKTMCFNENCFDVLVPLTNELKQQGLMYVESLEDDKGMLFVFEREARHSFWMKNTLIPLDMIWLNSDLEVVHIEKAIPCTQDPCRVYTPLANALYVLEINQGLSEELNITIGSVFYFK